MYLYEKYERKTQLNELNVQRVADENIIKYIYKGSRPAIIYYFKPVSLSIEELIESEVVYLQDKPVASARINFTLDSIFAGIWAGTTLKEYRGKGYYQILLNYRIDEAKQRGLQYVAIDALPTSRPIVEKHGFEFITSITPYIYRP